MYTSGELQDLRAVAAWIGCSPRSVAHRCHNEGWVADRTRLVARLAEQGESVAGLLRVQSTEQEAQSLASSRLAIASQILGLSSALIQQAEGLARALETALGQPPDRLQPDHTRTLLQCQGLLLDQLLRLSGLSGSSPVKSAPSPAPVPPSAGQRPGRDTSWAEPV